MENKNECQVVQDLLLGYVDDILNPESKRIVEKHLAECELCQNKLKEINADIKENEHNEKKQIDYLKKVRRKNRKKSILIAIVIVLCILLLIYLRNFIIFNNLMNKAKKNLENSNVYIETMSRNENQIRVEKRYYKDGKLKHVYGTYSDDGFEESSSIYRTLDSEKEITIYPDKRATILKGELIKKTNKEKYFKSIPLVKDDRIFVRIAMPALATLSSGKYTNSECIYSNNNYDKKCYVLRSRFKHEENYEVWIDKQIGLTLKEVNKEAGTIYYDNDDKLEVTPEGNIKDNRIIKERYDRIDEYYYKFDIVTDEDVTVPDLTDYEVEEHEWNFN